MMNFLLSWVLVPALIAVLVWYGFRVLAEKRGDPSAPLASVMRAEIGPTLRDAGGLLAGLLSAGPGALWSRISGGGGYYDAVPAGAPVPAPAPAAAAGPKLPPPPSPQQAADMAPHPLNATDPEAGPAISAAQSDVLYGINSLVSQASSGDIIVVRRVVKTLSAVLSVAGAGINRLGNRLAEPDKHYGSEIWEAVLQAGAQAHAGSLHMEQADSMVESLLRHTVAELAASARQAPHHSQLNGGA